MFLLTGDALAVGVEEVVLLLLLCDVELDELDELDEVFVELDCVELEELDDEEDFEELDGDELDCVELDCVELDCVELDCLEELLGLCELLEGVIELEEA